MRVAVPLPIHFAAAGSNPTWSPGELAAITEPIPGTFLHGRHPGSTETLHLHHTRGSRAAEQNRPAATVDPVFRGFPVLVQRLLVRAFQEGTRACRRLRRHTSGIRALLRAHRYSARV